MKISIISDLHLGYGQNTERENDSFEAFQEAVEKSLDCDVILLGGDMFDMKIPNTEVFTSAIGILKKTLEKENGIRIIGGVNKNTDEFPLIKQGIPVIGIAGNHERRVKGLLNPVEALEKAGFLIYLHCNAIVLEKAGEKIAVHGMSSVPDQFGEQVLGEWDPKPIDDCFNILIMHQSIAPFLYAPHLIKLEKIPRGFDLYINGHVHGSVKTEYDGKPFIIPGSLLPTQITKDLDKHSFCKLETENKKIKSLEFVQLDKQRDIHYLEFLDKDADIKPIENKIQEIIKVKRNLKPIIKIVLYNKNLQTKELEERYKEFSLLQFQKKLPEEENRIEAKSIIERIESVNDLSKKLLRENMKSMNLDIETFENLFELLDNQKKGEAEKLLEQFIDNQSSDEIKKPVPVPV